MNTNSLPKISVVIPVLNNVNTIEKAILSVIQQNYENTELIILDAGSTDGTVDIIKRYESAIYYWHSKPDGSSGLAINMGIEKSTGDLIAQLMADDWFELSTFHAIAEAFIENPDADVISCGGRIVHLDAVTNEYKTKMTYVNPAQLKLDFQSMCFGLPVMSSRFLTAKLLKKIGLMIPFDANGKHNFSADRELLLRAVAYRCKNVIINHLGHTYFAHAESATFGKNRSNQIKVYQEHMTIVESYLQKYPLSRQEKAILQHWYNDQSVRLLLFKLMAFDLKAAWRIAKTGMKQFKLQWPIALLFTPCKIVLKKMRF